MKAGLDGRALASLTFDHQLGGGNELFTGLGPAPMSRELVNGALNFRVNAY